MNPGIFYLYEYKNNQKYRNVGFLKLIRHYRACTLQLHARGIPVTRQDTMKLSTFYMENETAHANFLTDIACDNRAASARLNIADSQLPNQHTLNDIQGFLLQLPNSGILAVTSPGITLNPQKIIYYNQEPNSPSAISESAQTPNSSNIHPEPAFDSTDTESRQAPDITKMQPNSVSYSIATSPLQAPDITKTRPEPAFDSTDTEPAQTPDSPKTTISPASDSATPIPAQMSNSSKIPTAPTSVSSPRTDTIDAKPTIPSTGTVLSASVRTTDSDAHSSTTPDTRSEDDFSCQTTSDTCSEDDSSCQTTPDTRSEDDSSCQTTPDTRSEDDSSCQTTSDTYSEADPLDSCGPSAPPEETIRKIQRADMSTLPRRYWNLANNSFLLHGYNNYNHLLLIEKDGHYWLGVPGIYDTREARAAELFGFPQFTNSYNEKLTLSKDECSEHGDFGYWCRYLK